jgi:cell wall-associated NlpC family hydrolase
VHERTSHRRRRSNVSGPVALSLGLALTATQLVATSPASAAPTPVEAAAAVTTVKPKITTSYNKKSIAWSTKVKVTAKLINPKTGKAVTSGKVKLQIRTSGKKAWKTWQTRSVNSKGTVVFNSKPSTTAYYRTLFAGTKTYTSVASPSTKITVKASGAKILAEAKKHKGALYKFAASGPKRFDCSGYTMYVYKKAAGKKLPHKANSQQKYGKSVSKKSKRVGDLIVFRSGSYGTHAGIYAGNGYMWDSPHSGARVGKHKIYGSNYVVRRLVSA